MRVKFLRKYTIASKSKSCTCNYPMQISKMELYFKTSPLEHFIAPTEGIDKNGQRINRKQDGAFLKDVEQMSKKDWSKTVQDEDSLYGVPIVSEPCYFAFAQITRLD